MRTLVALLFLLSATARGDGLLVGASAGGFVPLSRLDATVTVGVEAGWARGPLGVTLAFDAAQPATDGKVDEVGYTLRVRELRAALLVHGRLRLGAITGFAAAGPALLFVDSRESGAGFRTRERSLRAAGVASVGVERGLGRGALVGAVVLGLAGFDGALTGEASAAALELRLGYRVWL